MWHKQSAFLWDAQDAAKAIAEFLEGIDAQSFAASRLIQAAVERKFEIIGESPGNLARIDPTMAGRIPDLPRIVAFRNLLIHGCAVVDQARVWAIAHEYLPVLRAVLENLLSESGDPN